MPRFRNMKRLLRETLLSPAPGRGAACRPDPGGEMEAVGPLIACLPEGGLLKWRAVLALGRTVAALAGRDREQARVVMRRLLWQMNEDSGNIGWGVCEAMGEICARDPALAAEYGRIALSYLRDTGKADNYVEHGPLRRGAYWAAGRIAAACPPLREAAWPLLLRGLTDEDIPSRGIAAWGIARGVAAAGSGSGGAAARTLLRPLLADETPCELLDGDAVREESVAAFAREALEQCTANLGGTP